MARAPILQLQDRLPPGPERHPPAPGQAASVARAAFLHLQDGLPPWPGRPSSSSRTGYLRGLGGLPVNGYRALVEYLKVSYDITISLGGLNKILKQASAAVRPIYLEVLDAVRLEEHTHI
ncbi:MAG: hypothetical protein LBQ79_07030, partial [Deltaproteobacteria bacterium]|nr:hypothetical protein [Deltaproteobacteria bacterium]